MPSATQAPTDGNVYRVKLVTQTTSGEAPTGQERVIFDVTPDISESRTVNYTTLDPVHMPGQIFVYKNTTSRTFSVSGAKLVSRTTEEAEKNLEYLWLLRSWVMPRFGLGSSSLTPSEKARRRAIKADSSFYSQSEMNELNEQGKFGKELLGAPPPVLLFSAYSRGSGGSVGGSNSQSALREHISRVPVVMQNLTIPYPSDVDYILSSSGVPMPTIMNVDFALLETHSAGEYERFNLNQYKAGILPNF